MWQLPTRDSVFEAAWGVSTSLLPSLPPSPSVPWRQLRPAGHRYTQLTGRGSELQPAVHSDTAAGLSVGFSVGEGDTLSLTVCHQHSSPSYSLLLSGDVYMVLSPGPLLSPVSCFSNKCHSNSSPTLVSVLRPRFKQHNCSLCNCPPVVGNLGGVWLFSAAEDGVWNSFESRASSRVTTASRGHVQSWGCWL